MNQSKQLQELKNQTRFLNDSLTKLSVKVDSFATHNKMLETQIFQVAQQVATSSQIIKKLPPKLGDPGSFSIHCVIGIETIDKVVCDVGAS